ncbi:MAG: zinc ABC transporter substrate-binding protein [Alphaproteobacteria bacterium]|nr:zinc ABC transporter substrate-binding protein [Alphaproteobacteria bacterium]
MVVSFTSRSSKISHKRSGDVAVTSLIGRDRDPHAFEPTPDQARLLSHAQLFIVNGLGFEGWLLRLTNSAQYHGPVIVATQGITPITTTGPGGGVSVPDPHPWQDARNGTVYAGNIAQALAAVDPAHADRYRHRLREYQAKLGELDRHVRAELGAIPAQQRRVITTHDAFSYYGRAYGVTFLAAEGISPNSEPSVQAVAQLIRQIRQERIKALFLENISDPRLIDGLAGETGTTPGPPLYSDALSRPDGPAPTYIRMLEYNTAVLKQGMLKN